MPDEYHDLVCSHCGSRETLRIGQLLDRLRSSGVLRRAQDPDPDEIVELFRANLGRMACESCKAVGLTLVDPVVHDDDDAWGDPKPCERCGKLIPAERMELFPGTTLCVTCQQASERGEDRGPAEYCPRCGTIMQLRKGRSGITRYVMECPACRR